MKRIGCFIYEVLAVIIGLLVYLAVNILVIFSKRVRRFNAEEEVKLSYSHDD